MKKVSVIMPSYNCEKYIAASIDSVINQTYTEWELLIVDDVSTDKTKDIIKSYIKQDARIKLFVMEENSGAALCRNKAVEEASGQFIAFLDSDDIWSEEKLKLQLSFMLENNYSITCTGYQQIDSQGVGRTFLPKTKVDYEGILLTCPVGNSTVIYNCENLGKIYTPNIRKRNDDALWLKMLKKEKYIYGMQDILMYYRIRPGSISSNKLSLVKYHWILYRKIEKLTIRKSIFHIGYWGYLKIFRKK